MTIKEFLEKAKASDTLEICMESAEVWKNDAALGYAVVAAQAIGLNPTQITELMDAMQAAMENTTMDEAATLYQHGNY